MNGTAVVAVFPAVASSVPAVRSWVCQHLARRRHHEVREVVGLLVSELTANAIRHTTTAGLTVWLDSTDDSVAVAVRDDSTAVPQIRPADPWADGGRGLPLVQALSDTWGVCTETDGKWVWFTLQHAMPTAGT